MAKLSVYNMNGEQIRELEVSDAVFAAEVHHDVLHRTVLMQLANRRQGTVGVKGRSDVRGGGRKPYRQKGTGRARQGSTRAAQHVGGGVIFGPVARSFRTRLPKKMRRLAMRSALSSCVTDAKLKVLDRLELEAIRTKDMLNVLKHFQAESSTLLVLPEKSKNVQLSARNLPGVKVDLVNTINVFDLLKYEHVFMTEASLRKLEEVYA